MTTFTGTSSDDILPPLATGAVDAAGDDTINGLAGDDTLAGWAGDDLLNGGAGADILIGGTVSITGNTGTTAPAGTDTASYADSPEGVLIYLNTVGSYTRVVDGITLTLANATVGHGGDAEGDYLTGINSLIGSAFADRLVGNNLANTLQGGAGDDRLVGGGGGDTMVGGTGNDIYGVDNAGDTVIELANEGDDTVIATVDYTLPANVETLELRGHAIRGTGNNLDNVITGNDEDNILDGGGGLDVLSGGDGNDTLSNGDYLWGGSGNDILLNGSSGMWGEAGDDQLYGSSRRDVLYGGNGNDILVGGGNPEEGFGSGDYMEGGNGDDIYSVDSSFDVVAEWIGYPNTGYDRVNASVDYTLPAYVEALSLTGHAVHGEGNGLDNLINGNDFANVLDGADGNDTLLGRGGNDSLAGGNGNDRLFGGIGGDTLTGGQGNDTFAYTAIADSTLGAGADTIADFTASDKIDLSAIDANSVGGTSNDAFIYIGGSSFSGVAGQLRFTNGVLSADVNGDRVADLAIRLTNVTSLSSSSLVL